MAKSVRPYGEWPSPISSGAVASAGISIRQTGADGSDIYWVEGRPADGGRCVVVRREADGTATDLLDAPWSVRTHAHEYGGGEFLAHDGVVYFSQDDDQRLYRVVPGENPTPLTPPGPWRYADAAFDAKRGRVICVREDHGVDGEPECRLVSIDAAGAGDAVVFPCESDFVSSPRVSPCGARLAWITWDHPNMPWDGTSLWVADLDADGRPGEPHHVAGGEDESIFQPAWTPGGDLIFVSDRTGWWNLYRLREGATQRLVAMDAEFGRPQWVFGLSAYSVTADAELVCSYKEDGRCRMGRLDLDTLVLREIAVPQTEFGGLGAGAGFVLYRGGSPTQSDALLRLDLATNEVTAVRSSRADAPTEAMVSVPDAIRFPTEGDKEAHAFYYPPTNAEYEAPPDETPPLIVMSHGGPTSDTVDMYNPSIQYWTTRGYAVLDVNYGGSSGYGREYRNRLRGTWGIVDVDDCINAALHVASRGQADRDRLLIRGGSAGGYTTLAALTFRDVFRAGCSRYGISDLEALASDTHKFEARYLDRLVGPYPDAKDVYVERSPIHSADRLACPVVFLQGSEDKVVPPNQAEAMVDVLRDKGIPVAYVLFEGEGHGFRVAENIARALDVEQYFYARVLGIDPADELDPTPIDNLPG